MNLLQTSPLLLFRPEGEWTVAGRPFCGRLSLDEIEMLSMFSEPTSIDEGVESGFNRAMIENAVIQGLLVPCEENATSDGSN